MKINGLEVPDAALAELVEAARVHTRYSLALDDIDDYDPNDPAVVRYDDADRSLLEAVDLACEAELNIAAPPWR